MDLRAERESLQQFLQTLKVHFFSLEIKERHFLFGLECSMKKRKCLHLRRAVIAQDTQHMHLRYTSWSNLFQYKCISSSKLYVFPFLKEASAILFTTALSSERYPYIMYDDQSVYANPYLTPTPLYHFGVQLIQVDHHLKLCDTF